MPRQKAVSELTRRSIQRVYAQGGISKAELARQHGISEATVKRICHGIKAGGGPAQQIIAQAIAEHRPIVIDGLDLGEMVGTAIKDLSAAAIAVEGKSKEGVSTAMLKYLQFYVQLHPPTMEAMVDQLLGMPDFDPARFVKLLKEKYAQRAAG